MSGARHRAHQERCRARGGAQHARAEVAPASETPAETKRAAIPTPSSGLAMRVDDLGVKYNLRFTKKTKLRTTFANMLKREKGDKTFWALRHTSFELKRGESLGVIGPNGAGKSTLLLVLAGIITPVGGRGRGQRPHLHAAEPCRPASTRSCRGCENIALAGALMGIDHKTMQEITPGVIEFADIGAFIEAPLKTYSSGMRARLGFAIATSVDPDILLLDEVLQTGDEVFREKSRQRIIDILKVAKAVVLVTHDMTWVDRSSARGPSSSRRAASPWTVTRRRSSNLHMAHSADRKRLKKERIEAMRRGEIAIKPARGR